MSNEDLNNFVYEDEYLRYESYLKDFSKDKFDEFDAIAEKVGLDSKIKDLMDSKIVNETENQAALHPEYRRIYLYGLNGRTTMSSSINYDFESGKGFYEDINTELGSYNDSKEPVNIVSIGIGGSFEGPKLMLEASNKFIEFDKSMNFELFPLVSKSLTKSKLFIASTLFSSLNTSMIIVAVERVGEVPIPTFILLSMKVSAKFFNPAG